MAATRDLIEHKIDWPCQIKRFYSDKNQGCRRSVSRAISWFFEQVEGGIILEDDCLPHPDFFPYCANLLERYRYDTRVWSICGSNFQLGRKRGEASYYFSIHGDSWGWATWRRAWQHYPEAEWQWVNFRDAGRLDDIFPISRERDYWRGILDQLFLQGSPDSWAYQWWLASWMNNALHAWPNACLISNRGFDGDGTHTFGDNQFASLALQGLGELRHPEFVLPCRAADEFAFLHRRGGMGLIERERHGQYYPWVLRFRQMRKEGFHHYLYSRIRRKLGVGN
ncbi:nucleotide-diphospho-sugar transferase [Synechococcus sp. CBW1107]|uniref:nucleotide-diphospho-sugar transferase n=1 Tax=Synechococcus sp. CBW1107 TaxID=2789857 RepID=UPI002AD38050|nr:nucleotide-diphospho-sugar transferase [Synechococcus sp. CBW1107]